MRQVGWLTADRTRMRVAALVATLLSVVITLAASRQDGVAIALNALFWLGILAFASTHAPLSELRLFMPLTLLFYFTFYFNRDLVEIWDKILNSDTPRYLLESTALRAQSRHLGFTVITFPLVVFNRLGSEMVGLQNLGREFLYLQVAFAGTLATSLIHSLLFRHEHPASRWRRVRPLLIGYLFAFSFAVWGLSSVIDTFMVSTMVLAMFLLEVRDRFLTGSKISSVTLGLITALALSISLENVYFIGLAGLAFGYERARGHGRRQLQDTGRYLGIVLLSFGLILQCAAAAGGPDFYRTSGDEAFPTPSTNLVDNIHRFARRYVDLRGALSVTAAMGVGYKTWIMSIRAEQRAPVAAYAIPSRITSTGNLVFASLLVPLVLITMQGLLRPLSSDVRFTVFIVVGLLIVRYGFMLLYARQQNALFSTPSIAGFWVLIGLGLSQHLESGNGRSEKLVMAVLAIVGAFLFINNGYYLLRIA